MWLSGDRIFKMGEQKMQSPALRACLTSACSGNGKEALVAVVQ